MKKNLVFLGILCALSMSYGQNSLMVSDRLLKSIDPVYPKIVLTLDSLYNQITSGNLNSYFFDTRRSNLTQAILNRYLTPEFNSETSNSDKTAQLINLYPIDKNKYFASIAILEKGSDVRLAYVIDLLAEEIDSKIKLSCPLFYHTQKWKHEKVGKINYYYQDSLVSSRAKLFNKKNNVIANKLGLSPEEFSFYMCDNEQEVLRLLGISYSKSRSGQIRNGFGIYDNLICSIMNNEDFSHDIFHYYSGEINSSKTRNWISEEGIAYLWGNAYYTDDQGEMITFDRMINSLSEYVIDNPDDDLLSMFKENKKILSDLAAEVSVRSVISGLLANEVEQKVGIDGILRLINCGKENYILDYLKAVEELLDIPTKDFDKKVRELVLTF